MPIFLALFVFLCFSGALSHIGMLLISVVVASVLFRRQPQTVLLPLCLAFAFYHMLMLALGIALAITVYEVVAGRRRWGAWTARQPNKRWKWKPGTRRSKRVAKVKDATREYERPLVTRSIVNPKAPGAVFKQGDSLGSLTPEAFEQYCAEVLRKNGWDISLTPKSRDQGVDVIATRFGKKLAIQCKRFSSPVGNAAVQQIVAGRAFVDAHSAIVVTTSSYTGPARELARANQVGLLHAHDLHKLFRIEDVSDIVFGTN